MNASAIKNQISKDNISKKLQIIFKPQNAHEEMLSNEIKKKWGRNIYSLFWKLFRLILFLGLIFVLIYPLLFLFSISLRTFDDMVDPTTIWIPKKPTFARYAEAYKALDYLLSLKNTFLTSIFPTIFNVIMCSLIGYGFARFRFREKNFLFALVLFTLIVPPQVTIVPQYLQYSNFDFFGLMKLFNKHAGINLLNTYVPLILPSLFGLGLKSGLFIYIFRQFFRGMPKELEDAAYIDGCSPFQTYIRIFLPNAVPAIVTVFLFSFVWHWNDVFEPTIYLNDIKNYTLAMRLASIDNFITGSAQVFDPIKVTPPKYAGVILVILPMLILYVFAQRYFIESVERSGIVG
ncbi:carbohydrate ABC transporter permease [Caldicellulosiruptoraceae bacterium PP1]